MTIFSGVVAILSPSFMSRLPARSTTNKTKCKTKGPVVELGDVLERMQRECGVACTRTAENVCMVQGEWEAIRKAYSFLDGGGGETAAEGAGAALPSPPPAPTPTKAGGGVPTYTVTPTGLALLDTRTPSPPSGGGVDETPGKGEREDGKLGESGLGRSGAMKRKQGKPRRQVQSQEADTDVPDIDSSSDVDVETDGEIAVSAPYIARDSGGFANGDSSIQIVAAWGNFKEENIDEMSQQNKLTGFTPTSGQGVGKRPQVKQESLAGLYTWGDDSQGNPVMIAAETVQSQPVYILNVDDGSETYTKVESEDASCSFSAPTMYGTSDGSFSFKSPKKSNSRKTSHPKASMATARKSTTPKISGARKSSTPRTVYIVAKKSTTQPVAKVVQSKKKGKSVSPRRRGIIQGKAASANMMGEFTCNYCQKQFSTVEAIQVHEEVYHTGRYKGMPSSSKSPLFECNQCGKSYMSKHALEEHMYTHVGMRPFGCPYCAASFNHRKSLRRHVQLHNDHGVRLFDCPHCKKKFMRKDALESHLRVHKLEMDETE